MNRLKTLIKSYGFWTALAGALVVLIGAIGDICGFQIKDELVTNIIMAIAGVLVVFGVVSMPGKEEPKKEESENQDKSEEE